MAIPPTPDQGEIEFLVEQLRGISKFSGVISLSEEALNKAGSLAGAAKSLVDSYGGSIPEGVLEDFKESMNLFDEVRGRISTSKELSQEQFNEFLGKWYQTPLFGKITNHPNFKQLMSKRASQNIRHLERALRILSVGNQPDLLPVLQDNEIPILYLSGTLDQKYNQLGEELASTIPHLHHQSFSDLGHNIHFEDLDKVVKVINQFLSVSTKELHEKVCPTPRLFERRVERYSSTAQSDLRSRFEQLSFYRYVFYFYLAAL